MNNEEHGITNDDAKELSDYIFLDSRRYDYLAKGE